MKNIDQNGNRYSAVRFYKHNNLLLYKGDYFPYETYEFDGIMYYRFMNNILLPKKTNMLDVTEIASLNELRERIIHNDNHALYNLHVNKIIGNVASSIECNSNIMEIGPGRNPVKFFHKNNLKCYDIDRKSSKFLLDQNFGSLTDKEFFTHGTSSVNIVVACFVFHFNISDELVNNIERILDDSGVLIFNVLTKDADIKVNAANLFSNVGFVAKSIDIGAKYKKNDTLFILTKSRNAPKLEKCFDVASAIVERGLKWH